MSRAAICGTRFPERRFWSTPHTLGYAENYFSGSWPNKKTYHHKRSWEKSCPQRRINCRFCTTLPSFAMRRLFGGPTLLHVRLIFIPPRNHEVLVWTNAPSLLLDFRSPYPPSLLLFPRISETNPKLLVWTNSPSLLLDFPVTPKP